MNAIPDHLAVIVGRCLAKDPADRFSSSLELADEPARRDPATQEHRKPDPREACAVLDCFLEGSRNTFRITLPQQRGERLPEVIVEVNEGKDNERFLSVFSVCGPAEPSRSLPRQGSSACCCILTRRASEGSASKPALARRKICEI